MDAGSVAILVLILFVIILVLLVIIGAQHASLREVRKSFIQFKLDQNLAMALYVECARENRQLVVKYNRLKLVINKTMLKDMTLKEVMDWYKGHDLDDRWATTEQNSNEVNKNADRVLKEQSNYEKLIGKP